MHPRIEEIIRETSEASGLSEAYITRLLTWKGNSSDYKKVATGVVLTDEERQHVRIRLALGESVTSVADAYGMSWWQVDKIRQRKPSCPFDRWRKHRQPGTVRNFNDLLTHYDRNFPSAHDAAVEFIKGNGCTEADLQALYASGLIG